MKAVEDQWVPLAADLQAALEAMPRHGERVFHFVGQNRPIASKAVCDRLQNAAKRAGVRLEEVWLAQSGGHLDAFYNEASVNVKSADNTVTALDIASVCELAKEKDLPAGRSRIHEIRRPFRLKTWLCRCLPRLGHQLRHCGPIQPFRPSPERLSRCQTMCHCRLC